jgi:hypothetical protein
VDRDAVAELLGRFQELTRLAKPLEDELPVVLAGERLQQGEPLEPEQVRPSRSHSYFS